MRASPQSLRSCASADRDARVSAIVAAINLRPRHILISFARPVASSSLFKAFGVLLLLSLLVVGGAVAAPVAIDTAVWHPSADASAGPPDADDERSFVRFDPQVLQRMKRNPDGVWLRVRPRGTWPDGPLVLVLRRVVFGAVELHVPGTVGALRGDIADPRTTGLSGYGAPVFELPRNLPRSAPLLLHVKPHPTGDPGVTIAVQSLEDYLRDNALWVAFASACLAAMAMMALTAIVFGAILRDRAYLFYAVYLGCFIVLEALSTGFLFTVLHWHAWAPAIGVVGRLVTVLSIISASLFLIDFTRMRHVAPVMHRLLLGYVVAVAVVLAPALLSIPTLMAVARALVNPLLAVGALLLPIAALVTWIRGSRYGAYFLLGWLPLMAATFMGAMQAAGAFPSWTWLEDSLLVAGAFEALVLAVGLADRALAHRRHFDDARQRSMTDPLTGLLNRRAWEEQLLGLAEQTQRAGQRLYVLFVDLDHFKSLNDTFGHRAGDEALCSVAAAMKRTLPPDSLVCRYGGEEFVVAVNVSGSAQAHSIAETLRASVASRAIAVDAAGTALTLSIGLARHRSGDSAQATVEQADRAMYQAKSSGRNRVVELDEVF